MATLVTIGDFSRMTYLTVKALRHYHDIGLLEPASIDPDNGYRRYRTDQVATAQAIRRFRELEMPTEEIRAVLDAEDEAERTARIAVHLDRMESQLERTRETVAALRELLVDQPPRLVVEHRHLAPARAVAIREEVRFDDAADWCDAVYEELHALLDTSGGVVTGPDGALYDDSFFEDGEGAITAFVPIRRDVAPSGRVVLVDVPGFEAAVARHEGPFATLDQTYRVLGTHVAEAGTGATGPMREHYLDDETIEVCWPVEGPA